MGKENNAGSRLVRLRWFVGTIKKLTDEYSRNRLEKSLGTLMGKLREGEWQPVQPEVMEMAIRPIVTYRNVIFPAVDLYPYLINLPAYSLSPWTELSPGKYDTLDGKRILIHAPHKIDFRETQILLRPIKSGVRIQDEDWLCFPSKNPNLHFDLPKAIARLKSVSLDGRDFSLLKKNNDVIALACLIWRRNEGIADLSVEDINALTGKNYDRTRDYFQSNGKVSPLWQSVVIKSRHGRYGLKRNSIFS